MKKIKRNRQPEHQKIDKPSWRLLQLPLSLYACPTHPEETLEQEGRRGCCACSSENSSLWCSLLWEFCCSTNKEHYPLIQRSRRTQTLWKSENCGQEAQTELLERLSAQMMVVRCSLPLSSPLSFLRRPFFCCDLTVTENSSIVLEPSILLLKFRIPSILLAILLGVLVLLPA